jgi:hypothetical protein
MNYELVFDIHWKSIDLMLVSEMIILKWNAGDCL